ncbi:DNA pilot protein [Sigmofec virus UA08Rod_4888]|uniref:DNA pilot protein n=1 Tax=Sigmofec virus UA08Rod_4888 TaxID=2929412 RepID=A0A976R8M1_9VIRU|nr:DNA pilot protein [Sigmofec virus UA08Rod_4888]
MGIFDWMLGQASAAISQGYNEKNMALQQGYNRENMQAMYQYGEQAADNAMKRKEDFYLKYETPEAIRKQLEDAGLGIGLMYGGGGAGGSASGGAQGTGANGSNPSSQGPGMVTGSIGLLDAQAQISQIQKIKEETRSQKIDNDAKEENAKNLYDIQYRKAVGEEEAKRIENQILMFEKDMKRIDNKYYEENAVERLKKLSEEFREQRLKNNFTQETWEATKKEQNTRIDKLAQEVINQEFQNKLTSEQREGIMKIFENSVSVSDLEAKIKEWEKEITRDKGQIAKNNADARDSKGFVSSIANGLEGLLHRLTGLIPIKL